MSNPNGMLRSQRGVSFDASGPSAIEWATFVPIVEYCEVAGTLLKCGPSLVRTAEYT